jgi:uncharacterized protein
MHDVTHLDFSRIAQDLQIRKLQVESVVGLLDEGNTVPFITRYRKERTGGLQEDLIRQIQMRVSRLRQLAERKQTILKSIETQGKLTDDLRTAILRADTSKRLEDLYLPFKPKKKSLASAARERGLEPLALAIWHRDPAVLNLAEVLPTLVNPEKELTTVDDVKNGVQHILAEMIAETADVRAAIRSVLWETGKLCSTKNEKLQETQGLEYKDYFQFSEPVRQIPPHRILALNRGEKEGVLKVKLEWHVEGVNQTVIRAVAESALEGLQRPSPAPAAASPAPTETPASAEGSPAALSAGAPALTPEQEGELLTPSCSYKTPHASLIRAVIEDSLNRLLLPSLEREIRQELREEAEDHAVAVFARNLRSLLLQPPLRNRRVLAIDPGFRTGCKLAALDEFGNLLEEGVIYPHTLRRSGTDRPAKTAKEGTSTGSEAAVASEPAPAVERPATGTDSPSPAPAATTATPESAAAAPVPEPTPEAPDNTAAAMPAATQQSAEPKDDKREEAVNKLHELVTKHQINVIAIGNGTGCRETEEVVSALIGSRLPDLAYVIVNEAGASVYSVSPVGREEFPNFDSTLRGTVSIGRRLQDPLSELVKVDPQSIGVGLYQHDVNRKELKESLEGVVESCVNQVGVDLNTASVPLLRHVSGLNQLVAREIYDYRKQHGSFTSREQLLQVPNVGPTRFVQAAGFLKITAGTNPFDQTWIHPESYGVAQQMLAELGYAPQVVEDKARNEELQARLREVNVQETAQRLGAGAPTVQDILQALARPGRDPREDLPPPIFKKGILKLEDLQPGMELKGTVLNVVDFGAFVDIGLKESGLVHISQMANRYIKSPYDVVAVSDVVTVWVLTVDKERHRVSLTMIKPGTERKPPEKKPLPPRQQQAEGGRPPRGRRHGRPQEQQQQSQQQQQHQGQRPRSGRPAGPGRGPGQQAPAEAAAAATPPESGQTGSRPAGPPPRPVPPPRKPRREPPRPKLSQAAIEGKVPLRTFSELSALFAAKQAPPPKREPPQEPQPAPPPEPPVPVAAEAATVASSEGTPEEPPPGMIHES